MSDTLFICMGGWARHWYHGDKCRRCGEPRLEVPAPPKDGKPICAGRYKRHRFTGAAKCWRCGVTQAEVLISQRGQLCAQRRSTSTMSSQHHLSAKEDPYAAGYEAFTKNLRNPFKEGDTRRDQWFEGWHKAIEDFNRLDLEVA